MKKNRENRSKLRLFLDGLRFLLALLIALPSPLWANPSGGQVAAGIANILDQGGKTVTINQ